MEPTEQPFDTSIFLHSEEVAIPLKNKLLPKRTATLPAANGSVNPLAGEVFIDCFGFKVTLEAKAAENAYLKQNRLTEENLLKRWRKVLERWESAPYSEKKKLCRKGIPQAIRREVWSNFFVIGCDEATSIERKTVFEHLCAMEPAINSEVSIIARDLHRTFVSHTWFTVRDGRGEALLRSVLLAYANGSPEVGYVQGMNFLAATIILQMEEALPSFWAFRQLMVDPKYQLGQFFAPDFPFLKRAFYVLNRLLQRYFGDVFSKLREYQMEPEFYATQGFLTLFSNELNIYLVYRIWDIFLCEGWKIIYRVILAFISLNTKRIKKAANECELLSVLRSLHDNQDVDLVLKRALHIKFKTSFLRKCEEEYSHHIS